MATTLSEAQATQAVALTTSFKAQQNRTAAKVAALVALYYQKRVNVAVPESVERWLELIIPHLIRASDTTAEQAAAYFDTLRRLEAPTAPAYSAAPATGMVDPGVRKSLLTVGPYDYTNKATQIRRLDVSPTEKRAMLQEAKEVTAKKLTHAAIRHAQAGGRQTIHDNSQKDRVALGWVRVTRADPCYFCAMLASRGLHYRPFREDSFELSNARFTGEGDAKVHDNCGCSLKPVFSNNDPLVQQTATFAEMWDAWGPDLLNFRRAYENYQRTGEGL